MTKGGSSGADVLVKIGGDVSEFQNSLAGVLGEVQTWVMGLNPVLAGAVAAVAAIGTAAVSVGLQYEEASNKIRTSTGATGADLQALMGDFKAVFVNVPEDAEKVATAIGDLNTRLGLTGKPLQDLTNQFLDLASVTGVDVAQAIQLGTRVFGDWGITADKQAATLDLIFKASQQTGASFDGLAAKVVQFGAPLRQMGFSLEESVALLGKFEKEGVNTELVMGSLRIALGKMAQDGVADVHGGLQQIMEDIKGAGSAGEANAIAIEKFGARAGPDMAAAIREGRFEIDGLLASLEASPETISAADSATETFSEKLGILWKNVQELLEPLGTTLVAAGTAALDAINGLWSGTGALSGVFSDLLGWFSPIVDAVTTNLAPALTTLGVALVGVGSYVADILGPVLTFLWNNVLVPLATLLRDTVTGAVNLVAGALSGFLSVLQSIPGVSSLFEQGQKTLQATLATVKTTTTDTTTETNKLKAAHEQIKTPTANHNTELGKLKTGHNEAKTAAQKHKEELDNLKKQHDITKLATTAHETALKNEKKAIDDANAALKNIHVELPKVTSDAVAATAALGDFGLSKVLKDMPPYLDTLEQRSNGAKAALKALGIEPKEDLKKLADDAKGYFETIQTSGTSSATEIDLAQKAYLGHLKTYYDQAGIDLPASLKTTLADLEGKYSTHTKNVADGDTSLFGQMKKNINQSITDLSTSLVKSLWEDPGSFGKKALAGLTAIGESVTTSFITPATTAITNFINGTLADLLGGKGFGGIMDHVKDLGGSITGIFGGGASAAAGGASSAAGSVAGAAAGTGAEVAGTVASAGGAAASAAGSAASSAGAFGMSAGMTATLGLVTSAIGAVGSILQAFGVGQGGQKDRLSSIDNATTFVAQMFGDRGVESGLKNMINDISNFVNGAFGGWYQKAFADLMWTQEQALDVIMNRIAPRLENMALAVTVNVKVLMDSDEITAKVEQNIEFDNRLVA